MSRNVFMTFTSSAALTLFPFVQNAIADDDVVASSSSSSSSEEAVEAPAPKQLSRTIEGCPKPINGKPNNCVATSNIKQLENYSPPWTFEVSPEEAYARLKGIFKNESTFTIVETDEELKYIRAEVPRINNVDSLEFLIKGDDKVVVFKSNEIVGYGLSDYGANKKRVDDLRLKSNGVFRLMGDGLTADSIDGGKFGKRNGIAGQLKAFYGLQSGEGFESVFEE